jgi:hypothetical protein
METKKHPYYLVALLLLLSACKQQGEVKITITVATPDSQRADAGAALYFIPADSGYYEHLLLCMQDTSPWDLIVRNKKNIATCTNNIKHCNDILKEPLRSDEVRYYKLERENAELTIKILNKRNTYWQTVLDTALTQLNSIIKYGIKQTTNDNGVYTKQLTPGKYRLLIESNTCKKMNGDNNFNRYSLH